MMTTMRGSEGLVSVSFFACVWSDDFRGVDRGVLADVLDPRVVAVGSEVSAECLTHAVEPAGLEILDRRSAVGIPLAEDYDESESGPAAPLLTGLVEAAVELHVEVE